MLTQVLIASTMLLFQEPGGTQPPEAKPKEEPKVITILREANDATRDVKSVSYVAEFEGTGVLVTRVGKAEGKVLKAFVKEEAQTMSIAAEGWFLLANSTEFTQHKFEAALNGSSLKVVDHQAETVTRGTGGNFFGQGGMSLVSALNMAEYGHPTPFQDEIGGTTQTLEGQTFIGDVLCDVVFIQYATAQAQQARWYFGVEDHLPRRVERLRTVNGNSGAAVLTLTNVKVNPEFSEDDFELESPEGYSKRRTGGPRPVGGGVGTGG